MQWISIGLMASGKAWRFGGLEMGGKTLRRKPFTFSYAYIISHYCAEHSMYSKGVQCLV